MLDLFEGKLNRFLSTGDVTKPIYLYLYQRFKFRNLYRYQARLYEVKRNYSLLFPTYEQMNSFDGNVQIVANEVKGCLLI